ncbi:MAG: hypothetical protein SGI74_11625 [Oligoflexia bacterium]|nr:hypothetical protein [Oligoflexia bacterium]
MKTLILSLTLTLLFSTAVQAEQLIVVECRSSNNKVKLHVTSNAGNTNLNLFVNEQASRDLKLDDYSKFAKNKLYTSQDLANTQRQQNSLVVLSVPRDVSFSTGEKFRASLENRDYDYDYYHGLYRYVDAGPLANGYVIRRWGSDTRLKCVVKN